MSDGKRLSAVSGEVYQPGGRGVYIDKIERFGWATADEPGEMAYVDKTDINIDPDYQRTAVVSKILAIASSWSWLACGVIVLGERNGKLWAIDGQHRVLASLRRSDIKKLPCIVFHTKSKKSEARGFYNANALRKAVGAVDKYRALLVAGDETAEYVDYVFKKHGLTVTTTGGANAAPFEIKCVSLCLRLASENRENFDRVFSFVASMCRDKMSISRNLLAGINYIHNHCGDGLENKRLASRMIDCGPGALIEGTARAAGYFAKGGEKVWAQGMIDVINKGLQYKFELDQSGK